MIGASKHGAKARMLPNGTDRGMSEAPSDHHAWLPLPQPLLRGTR